MPLFSERLNLCKPKVNSIKWEPNTISLQSKGKHSGTKERLSLPCLQIGKKKKKQRHGEDATPLQPGPVISLPIFTGQSSYLKASSRRIYGNNKIQNSQI